MFRPAALAAPIASLALLAAGTLAAAEPSLWPWKDRTPPDPALATLTSIESVTVAINQDDPPTVTIKAEATAPTPNFTELQFTSRIGDPTDRIFALDAKGRPPQDMTIQVLSPVTIEIEYAGAPIEHVGVVEIYGQNNCKAFSVKDNREAECTAKSLPAMPPTGTADGRQ